jgi:hypothetical protein
LPQVWFSEDVLKTEMIFENFMMKLQKIPLEEGEDDFRQGAVVEKAFFFVADAQDR